VLLRVLTATIVFSFATTTPVMSAAAQPIDSHAQTVAISDNDFVPKDQNLGDCISALPRPGCGSEEQGGWRQGLVFGALMIGLAFIVWRIVVGARKAKS
jgi:hypothetical protein